MASVSLRILLKGLVDYAGLFPPAGLAMSPAVQNFEHYGHSQNAWMLGRFILPAVRLAEFEEAFQNLDTNKNDSFNWRLSALIGPDLAADITAIQEFNDRYANSPGDRKIVIDTMELKAQSPDAIHHAAGIIPSRLQTFFEIPIAAALRENISAIKETKKCAKVRTGGETAELFPSAQDLAQFLAACSDSQVCFKATAGLHHPIRSAHCFTYQPDSPSGVMHGFLNVFLAASFMLDGMVPCIATDLLDEESSAAFRFTDESVSWREQSLSIAQLAAARQSFCLSFGSCSFAEPIQDLRALKLL